MTNPYTDTRSRAPDQPGPATRVASSTTEAASGAVSEVTDTAREQAGQVAEEVKAQARSLADQTREKVAEQARVQNERLASTARQLAHELEEMARYRGDSPASSVVSTVADGSRRVADYLDRYGPEGMLSEVQDFARRRPGAFLAVAFASGLVVGRLGKGVLAASSGRSGTGISPTERYSVPTQPRAPLAETVPPAQAGYPQAGYPEAGYQQPTYQQTGYPQPAQGEPTYPPTSGYSTSVPPEYPDDVAVGTATPPPTSYVEPVVEPEDVRYRPGEAP